MLHVIFVTLGTLFFFFFFFFIAQTQRSECLRRTGAGGPGRVSLIPVKLHPYFLDRNEKKKKGKKN